MNKKSEVLSLPELIKKRNGLMLQLKLGKSRDTGGLAKIRKEIARIKTKEERAIS